MIRGIKTPIKASSTFKGPMTISPYLSTNPNFSKRIGTQNRSSLNKIREIPMHIIIPLILKSLMPVFFGKKGKHFI